MKRWNILYPVNVRIPKWIDEIEFAIADMKICDANNCGWISVKDQIPDDECLCFSSKYHEMIIGYLYEDKVSASKYSAENNEVVLYDVTHWMPLPEPPKEGTKDDDYHG